MGNVEFKENGVPKLSIAKDSTPPKDIIKSAENILEILFSDSDVKESECLDAFLLNQSEGFFLYTLAVEVPTVKPYLTKTIDELFTTERLIWSTYRNTDTLPKEVMQQLKYIRTVLGTENVHIANRVCVENYIFYIEVLPLSKEEKQINEYKETIHKLETHISCMPGGDEYLAVQNIGGELVDIDKK